MSHYGSSYSRPDDRYNDQSSFRPDSGRYGGGGGGGGYGGGGYGGGGGGRSGGGLGAGLREITWDLSALPVFEKNFYMEHPDVTRRSETEADVWRQSKNITVFGRGIPKPVYSFEEASMPEYVLREVLKQGFKDRKSSTVCSPTLVKLNECLCYVASPIQSQGWPMALMGRDMIGISATGSGKTLAFLLPAMIHINAQVRYS